MCTAHECQPALQEPAEKDAAKKAAKVQVAVGSFPKPKVEAVQQLEIPAGCRVSNGFPKTGASPFWEAKLPPGEKHYSADAQSWRHQRSWSYNTSENGLAGGALRSQAIARQCAIDWLWDWHNTVREPKGGKDSKDPNSDKASEMPGSKSDKKGEKDEKKDEKSDKKGDKSDKKGDKSDKKGDKSGKNGDKSDNKGDKSTKTGKGKKQWDDEAD